MLHLAGRRWRHLIPADCPGCGRRVPGQALCAGCQASLQRDASLPRCAHCQHPLVQGHCPDCVLGAPACDRIVSAFDYRGTGRTLIHDYKNQGHLSLAWLLADQLQAALRTCGWAPAGPPECIVPVPAHRQALRQRGFSPPAEVARQLAAQLRVSYALDLVRRRHDSPRQALLARAQRLRSQQGVYVASERAAGLRVAVVDDVMTTGATLQAVAQAFRQAGAAQVEGWVLARALQFPACSTSS